MSVLLKIDDILIDGIYQKFAWKFQKLTGKTNFWLAEISCSMFIFSLVVIIGRYLAVEKIPVFWIMMALNLGAAIFFFERMKKDFREDEKRFFEKNDGSMNYMRITAFRGRIIVLAVFSVMATNDLLTFLAWGEYLRIILNSFMSISFTSMFYFLACTPLPPCKGRVKEWLEARKKKLELASATK